MSKLLEQWKKELGSGDYEIPEHVWKRANTLGERAGILFPGGLRFVQEAVDEYEAEQHLDHEGE